MDNHLEIFNEIFSQRDKFIRFAYYYVYDRPVAEDIVTDSFMYYWEKRKSLKNESNIPAYILTVIKHKCLDYLRLKRLHDDTHSKMFDDRAWEISMAIQSLEAFDPYRIMTGEMERTVNEALLKLPEKTRRIFLLNRVEEMTYSEISDMEDVSVKVVEYHISKALKILRDELKDLLPAGILLYSLCGKDLILPVFNYN